MWLSETRLQQLQTCYRATKRGISNVGKYRSVGSVAKVAKDMTVSKYKRIELIKSCIQWIKSIDKTLKEEIRSLPKLEYIHPSQLETVEKVLPMFESRHRDTWKLIPDKQKACIRLCQELIISDVTKVESILESILKQLDSPPLPELTNAALEMVARNTGIPIHINKQLTTGEIAPLVRQLIEAQLLNAETKTDDDGYLPPSFDVGHYSMQELITMNSIIQTSASKVPCERLPKSCIKICKRMTKNYYDNRPDTIKSGFLFGILPSELNCALLASVINRKEATESNFGHSDFDSINLARNRKYEERRTVDYRKKYAEKFLNTFKNYAFYQRFDIYHDFYEDVLDSWKQRVDLKNVEIFLRSFKSKPHGDDRPTTPVHDKIMDIFVPDSLRNLVILSVPIWLWNSEFSNYSNEGWRWGSTYRKHDAESVDLVSRHISKFKYLEAIKLVLQSPWIVNYPKFKDLFDLCKTRSIYFEVFFKQGTISADTFMDKYENRCLIYVPPGFGREIGKENYVFS